MTHCQFCNKEVKPLGKGPHEIRCPKNPHGINRKEATKQKKLPMFEKNKDGLYPCPFCDFKAQNAQGLGAHCASKHHNDFKKRQLERGREPKANLVGASVKTARSEVSTLIAKSRAKKQKQICGIDLTSLSLEHLQHIPNLAREEIEARFRSILSTM